MYFGTGTVWTQIDTTTRTGAGRYQFGKYFNGTSRCVAICDGVNFAAKWDGTTYTVINGTGAPTNPKFSTFFNSCLVLAGYTSGGGLQAFSISKPNNDTVFDGANGAIEINVHDEIVGIRSFRQVLYIFCKRSIYQLNGNTVATYAIAPVALGIGCIAYDSIQEVNGDIVYLSADGVRTLSGTMKLNDVELGDLSKPIINLANSVFTDAGSNADNICSTIVRRKNQYRLFYSPSQGNNAQDAAGILGAIRPGKQTMTQFGTYISIWEWATMRGIQAFCADSDFIASAEVVVHGDGDGFIYQQESGASFNGRNVVSSYLTAPLQLEDPEVRKLLQKLTIYLHLEGNATIILSSHFEFDNPFIGITPPTVTLPCTTSISVYGVAVYGVAVYGGSNQKFEVQTNIHGSGKIVQFGFDTNDTNPPHSIQGISIQYRPLGRR